MVKARAVGYGYPTNPNGLNQSKVEISQIQHDPIAGWPNPSSAQRTFAPSLLRVTIVLKMIAFSVASGTGFVGGMMFPFLYVGALAGNIVSQVTDLNMAFASTTMMVSVPMAFAPIPVMFMGIAIFSFMGTAYQSGAIAVGMLSAYATVSGSGILLKMAGLQRPAWNEMTPSVNKELLLKRS